MCGINSSELLFGMVPIATRGTVIESADLPVYEAVAQVVNDEKGAGFVNVDLVGSPTVDPLGEYKVRVLLNGRWTSIQGEDLSSFWLGVRAAGRAEIAPEGQGQ